MGYQKERKHEAQNLVLQKLLRGIKDWPMMVHSQIYPRQAADSKMKRAKSLKGLVILILDRRRKMAFLKIRLMS